MYISSSGRVPWSTSTAAKPSSRGSPESARTMPEDRTRPGETLGQLNKVPIYRFTRDH